jgi:hypothetical protein
MARGEVTGKKPTPTTDQGESESDSSAEDKAAPTVPLAWFSIPDFCVAHRLSQAMYFKLKKEGRAPREIAVGSRRFVTFADAERWRTAQPEAKAAQQQEESTAA